MMALCRPLLLLALFGSAQSLAVQYDGAEDAAGPWRFWKNPGKEKRALLVIQGLLRSVNRFWPKVERNFVAPNRAAGYNFTIVLHTSLTESCSEKNRELGKQDWCDKMTAEYGATPEERGATVRKLFADYDFVLADTEDKCYADPQHPRRATTEYLKGPYRLDKCSGTIHMSSRSTQALDSFRGKKGFNRVVIIRTDNCFELAGHPHENEPVLLDAACESHPGASIIGNLNQIPGFSYGRDYDHAWMLCDGSRARAFRDSLASFGLPCRDCHKTPKCPGIFCEGKVDCGKNICESVSILERAGVKFGTLDDYMVANYQLTNGTGNTIELREDEE